MFKIIINTTIFTPCITTGTYKYLLIQTVYVFNYDHCCFRPNKKLNALLSKQKCSRLNRSITIHSTFDNKAPETKKLFEYNIGGFAKTMYAFKRKIDVSCRLHFFKHLKCVSLASFVLRFKIVGRMYDGKKQTQYDVLQIVIERFLH